MPRARPMILESGLGPRVSGLSIILTKPKLVGDVRVMLASATVSADAFGPATVSWKKKWSWVSFSFAFGSFLNHARTASGPLSTLRAVGVAMAKKKRMMRIDGFSISLLCISIMKDEENILR